MIGVVVLLSGIVMVVYPATIAVYSGIFVWGALLVSYNHTQHVQCNHM